MPEPSPTDTSLLAAWREGDETAGRTLVRRHTPSLHRFFAIKAPDHVTDLVQSVFEAALRGPAFRGEAGFRTYLLAIARKLLLKHFRKQLRGERALKLAQMTASDVGGSPSIVAAHRQELRLLALALRRLPIDHQIALELFYWEELPVGEIAVVLDIAPGTVKSRLSRAREQLRDRIAQTEADPHVRARTSDNPERWAKELRAIEFGTDSAERELS
ncbi:MAG: sigma-70 family RNA polymerase sigma factor [Myxococcota bacterium]